MRELTREQAIQEIPDVVGQLVEMSKQSKKLIVEKVLEMKLQIHEGFTVPYLASIHGKHYKFFIDYCVMDYDGDEISIGTRFNSVVILETKEEILKMIVNELNLPTFSLN